MSDVSPLKKIVTRLRAPDGCPWDREQTHASLRSSLVEECYEVIEAINLSDDANLREELGDLLLHVVMHAHLAEERQAFTLDEVVAEVCEKLVRRHPHVFGDTTLSNSTEVLLQWEQIKQKEKGGKKSLLEGLPLALPALLRAQNAQKKAARVGFDWPSAEPVFDKITEEVAELREAIAQNSQPQIEDEMGDLFFSLVNLARKLNVDSETALAAGTEKFIQRFQGIERALAAQGRQLGDASVEEMNTLWEQQKKQALA